MKLLWLTNYPLPDIAKEIGINQTVNEGWLIGLSQLLIDKGHQLINCSVLDKYGNSQYFCNDKYIFYGIRNKNNEKYNPQLLVTMVDILTKEKPDIVHIMGTEFPHSYSMVQACMASGLITKCVVSVQGLISKIAIAYDIGIDDSAKKNRFFWDRIISDSISINKRKFQYRGDYENRVLENVKYVIGRTDWDHICVNQKNEKIKYFHGNEILRSVFYENKWEKDLCEKYTLIISQATYPIKGFHILLRVVTNLKRKFPQIKILVPSNTIYERAKKRFKFLNSDYTNYIVKLINRGNLWNNIEFLGSLSAEEMCKAYQRANVFVMCSTIENSSNSLGEAMMLGMPIVCSNVGGLTSMITHEKEGLLYPINEEYLLEAYIEKIFKNENYAQDMGRAARTRAQCTHNRDNNLESILNCYDMIRRG